MKTIKSYFPLLCIFLLLNSCFIYKTREPALVKNVDVNETIKVVKDEMKKQEDIGQGLSIWVLRDQIVTPQQARILGDLYLEYIDLMKSEFNIWHSSRAIANLYRLGDDKVKAELEEAYLKAKQQPKRLEGDFKDVAETHINGKEITTGFIHFGGVAYAHGHLVVPGNNNYIQSYEEYLELQKEGI